MEFETIVANWATDHCISATRVVAEHSGKAAFMEARRRFKDGACERVVRQILDKCMDRPTDHYEA